MITPEDNIVRFRLMHVIGVVGFAVLLAASPARADAESSDVDILVGEAAVPGTEPAAASEIHEEGTPPDLPATADILPATADILPATADIRTTADVLVAQAQVLPVQPPGSTAPTAPEPPDDEIEEYDPWIKFNEKMFDFNLKLDRHLLKPVAKAYDRVVPDQVQRSLKNAFENVGSVRRIVNTALQGRFDTSARELGRLVFNTVFGIGGLFDVAKSELGVERVDADTGQTFGVWGVPPGPYLIVPLLPPLTVRDGVGFVGDTFLNPISWVASTPVSIGVTAVRMVNERSLNLELFEDLEETVLDLYSAARNGYLQRRHTMILEGRADSVFFK